MTTQLKGGWLWLLAAGIAEVGFASALRLPATSDGANTAVLVLAIVSFECLSQALKTLPLSLSYAVWTGIGSLGVFIVGVTVFHEPATVARCLLVGGLVATLVALKLSTGGQNAPTSVGATPTDHAAG